MKTSINLATKKRAPSVLHQKVFVGSVIFFSTVFVLSAGVIGYRFYLSNQISVLKSEEARLIGQVNSNPEKKIKFLTVRDRISLIQKVINTREDINSKISEVTTILPANIDVGQVKGESEKISFRVDSDSLESLNLLIENKIEEYVAANSKTVKRIEMNSFKLNNSSLKYEANFTVEFNK